MMIPSSNQCPNCESTQIEGHSYDQDRDCVTQEMSCMDCDSTWLNCFAFIGYLNVETNDDDN